MRKIYALIITLIILSLNAEKIQLNDGDLNGFRILSNNSDNFEMEFGLSELFYTKVATEKGYFTELGFKNSKNTNTVGSPKLPIFRELIEFPVSSNPQVKIVSYKETEISLTDFGIMTKIIPAQQSYSKSTPPSEIKFVKNEESYSVDGYPAKENIAWVKKSGTMRGVDIGVLEIRPVSYNPVKNSLRIITDIKLNVIYTDIKSDPELSKAEHFSPYFKGQFSKLINHKTLTSKSDLTQYPVTYLIVANQTLNGNAKLQEFIDWKAAKGFNVITRYFASTATTADVDAWVENQYQTLTPKPTFLLIVGDQYGTYVIPTEQNPPLGSTGNVTVSDLLYSVIGTTSSTNRIPSIYVGRFSVNSLTDLDAQVDKTIWYEKTQFTSEADLSYLSNVMGTAGVDASYAASYGNPQIRYGMTYYFKNGYILPVDDSVVNITGIPYYYPASDAYGVNTEIINNVSAGVAFYNYTAHGGNSGFSDPSFYISNVDNLTNIGKYPFVVGNCCLTGSFRDTECFGESWLNAPDKGGIGFIGASMSTYWDEDLAMGIGEVVTGDITPPYTPDDQGMYDGMMRMDYPTQGGIRFAGLMAVEEENTSYTSSYWSSYHLFGDPSLMVYIGIPANNTVSHNTDLNPGDTFFTVQAIKGSYVGITDDDGVLHGAALADEFGYAVVPIEPFTTGSANIVVTSQFKKPYFASVPVVALDGPYLTVNDYNLSSVNFGESGTINLELKNIGIGISEGISVTVSSLSEFISFTDDQENYNSIAEKDSLNKDSAFSYKISPLTPDLEKIRIDLVMSDTSKNTYYGHINFTANSPSLSYFYTHDGDINPGDTKDITFTIVNNGSADLPDVSATLYEIGSNHVIISASQIISVISAGNSAEVTFTVIFNESINNGTEVNFKLDLTKDNGYENSYPFSLNVGMTDNFESGDFSQNNWYFSGDSQWIIDDSVVYSGTYSSKSGSILDNQSSSMMIDFEFIEDGTISFYKKISSEAGYDKLIFYIDEISQGSWSGEIDWSYSEFPVMTGPHTLTWTYSKDVNTIGGSDCAWIDNVLAAGLNGIEEEFSSVPEKPTLFQNYPNPFNPETTIKFAVPSIQDVKLNIYNSNGQFVENLVDKKMDRGIHSVNFNAEKLISGIYFYTLETDNATIVNKMLLIK